jgi:hypothetical protein
VARPLSSRGYGGKLADPEVRRQRARKARAAQDTLDYHIHKLIDDAPSLSAEQRNKLVALLRSA